MTTYTDRLHAEAKAAADRIVAVAAALPRDPCPAERLARGTVATAVAAAAACCVDDQLGFALMLAAELAARAADR